MVEYENNLAQIIIMIRRCVTNKNHVARLKVKVEVSSYTLCIGFNETCSYLPITWSSMLGFMNNVAQMIIVIRGCVANKNHVAISKFKVIDYT